nr:immunoglobulin heavy chain junction region [Mus musculus]
TVQERGYYDGTLGELWTT